MKKPRGRKSRDTVSLNLCYIFTKCLKLDDTRFPLVLWNRIIFMRLELSILYDSSMFVLNRRKTALRYVIFFVYQCAIVQYLCRNMSLHGRRALRYGSGSLKIYAAPCVFGWAKLLWWLLSHSVKQPSAYQYMLNKKFGPRAAGAALQFGSVSNSHKWLYLQPQLRLHKHCCSKWCKMIVKRGKKLGKNFTFKMLATCFLRNSAKFFGKIPRNSFLRNSAK
jgi:hypothetical protein